MKKSFIYMFEDKTFWKKFLVLFCILFVANLLINWSGTLAPALNAGETTVWYYIMFFAGLIGLFVPYGYSMSLLKSNLEHDFSNDLPGIEFVNNFVAGLKVVLSFFVLLILLIILFLVLFMLDRYTTGLFGDFMSNIINVIRFFVLITLLFFSIAMCCRYVVKPSYLNFVDFKSAAKLINFDVARYFKYFLLVALSTLILYILSMLAVSVLTKIGYVGLVIYCIFISLLWSYQTFLFAGLFSKAVLPEKI